MRLRLSYMTIALMVVGVHFCSPKKNELNLFIWSEYIPESVIRRFETESGIRVNVANYTSNEEMLAKIQAGGSVFDLAVPSEYFIGILLSEDAIDPFPKEALKNFGNLAPEFLNRGFDPGNQYTIPFMAGHGVLVYDSAKTPPMKSYRDLWRADLRNNIVVLDDIRATLGMVSRSLGYSWNEKDVSRLKEVGTAFKALVPNIKKFDSDSPKKLLIDGEVKAGFVWAAEAALAMKERLSLRAVIPEEGMYLWLDSFVLLKGAENPGNALEFVDFILRPDIGRDIALAYPYMTPNREAKKLLPKEMLSNTAIYPPDSEIQKSDFFEELGETLRVYDAIWTDAKR